MSEESLSPGNILESLRTVKRPVLIFGIGPVIDRDTRLKASDAHTTPNNEDVPFWSKNLAQAASVLYKQWTANEFILVGGQTGGPEYASESDLMQRYMEDFGVPKEKTKLERDSYDTPTNIINFLNLYTDPQAPVTEPEVDVLGSYWMLNRIKTFMKIFQVPVRNAFSAEEVLRFDARALRGRLTLDATKWNAEKLQELDDTVEMNDRSKFYTKQEGTEKRDFHERLLHDNLWVREMMMYPSRLLQPSANIQNDNRVRAIVALATKLYGEELEPYGFDLENDDPQTLRAKMRTFPWPFIPDDEKGKLVKSWAEETKSGQWPEVIMDRLKMLEDYSPTR